MITGILVTDGGPHSAEDWAYASASMLLSAINISPNSPRRAAIEMEMDTLRPKIASILIDHHQKVQAIEREKLGIDGARLSAALDASEHTDVDHAVGEVYALMSPLLEKAAVIQGGEISYALDLAVRDHLNRLIRERIETDLRTNMHIERAWHADKNPADQHAISFKAAQVGA
jgi:hypothetical protein